MGTSVQAASGEEMVKAGGATVAGTVVGYGAATAAGVSACSIVGGGAGIGAAAGPVGAAIGAVVGLAVYGVYKVFDDEGGK